MTFFLAMPCQAMYLYISYHITASQPASHRDGLYEKVKVKESERKSLRGYVFTFTLLYFSLLYFSLLYFTMLYFTLPYLTLPYFSLFYLTLLYFILL